MPRNPAWKTYNETVEQINAAYDETMKPARKKLSDNIEATEKRFNKKIEPLILERNRVIEQFKNDFAELTRGEEEKRNAAMMRAAQVRNAELAAQKKTDAEAAAA